MLLSMNFSEGDVSFPKALVCTKASTPSPKYLKHGFYLHRMFLCFGGVQVTEGEGMFAV